MLAGMIMSKDVNAGQAIKKEMGAAKKYALTEIYQTNMEIVSQLAQRIIII